MCCYWQYHKCINACLSCGTSKGSHLWTGSHGSNVSFSDKQFSQTEQTSPSLYSNTIYWILPVNEMYGHERHSVISYMGDLWKPVTIYISTISDTVSVHLYWPDTDTHQLDLEPAYKRMSRRSSLSLSVFFPRAFWLYQTTLLSLPCDLHQYPTHPISKRRRRRSHVFSESYRLTVPVSDHRDHYWNDEDQYYSRHTWLSNLRALRCHYWPETVNWNCIIPVLGDYGQWYAWPPARLLTGTAL